MVFSFYICRILDDLSYNYSGRFKFWRDFRDFFGHYDIFWTKENSSDSS